MKKNLFSLLEIAITCFLVLEVTFINNLIHILAIWMIVEVCISLYKAKGNIVSIIFLFILMYSITPFVYFVLGISISSYQTYDSAQYYNMIKVTQIQSLFQSIFIAFLGNGEKISSGFFKSKVKNNKAWFFSFLVMLSCFIMIDWKGMMLSLMTDGYTTQRNGSILCDYFVIFSLTNYKYSITKRQECINLISTIIVAIMSLFSGTRMSAIMLLLLVFILYFDKKINKKTTIALGIFGIFFMNIFQYIRQFKVPTFKQILLGDYNNTINMLRSNAGDVWYCSEVIYKLIHTNIFDIGFRIKSFIGTFFNAFLTTSHTPEEALVNIYITEHRLFPYPNNGGLIGITTYLWLGYAGTIMFAILLSTIVVQAINKQKRGQIGYISLLTVVTFPKWYTYNPRILFKFTFVGLVYCSFYKLFFRQNDKCFCFKRNNGGGRIIL